MITKAAMRLQWHYRLLAIAMTFTCTIYAGYALAPVIGAEIAKALAGDIAAAVYAGNAPERKALEMIEKVRIK